MAQGLSTDPTACPPTLFWKSFEQKILRENKHVGMAVVRKVPRWEKETENAKDEVERYPFRIHLNHLQSPKNKGTPLPLATTKRLYYCHCEARRAQTITSEDCFALFCFASGLPISSERSFQIQALHSEREFSSKIVRRKPEFRRKTVSAQWRLQNS